MKKIHDSFFFKCIFTTISLYIFILLPATCPAFQEEQANKETVPIHVCCSPDSPIAFPNDIIPLNAWTRFSTKLPLQHTWSVTAGTVTGEGPEANWNLKGVTPGDYTAIIKVHDNRGEFSSCSLQVIVRFPPLVLKGNSRETGRSFLLPNQQEALGYGLYSYLLLGSEPNELNRDRYKNAIVEYLRFPDISILENYIKPNELNITYLPMKIPLTESILKELDDKKFDFVARWVLRHYDFARARAIIKNFPGDLREGPYIFSFLPPQGRSISFHSYLFQDQSWVPPHLVSMWMKEFLNQAAQERFWKEQTFRKLLLNIRTAVGIIAIGLPEVKDAVTTSIAWIDELKQNK